MADVFDSATRSRIMSSIRKRDTRPELRVRRMLHRLGFRFRLHRADLPGVPDVVLPKYRTVVFIHGCFWHQHFCPLGKRPKSNRGYWLPKLKRNAERDAKHRQQLRVRRWRVVTIWECEIEDFEKLEQRLHRIRQVQLRDF